MPTLPFFWSLASADESDRLNASSLLIKSIGNFQSSLNSAGSSESDSDVEVLDGEEESDKKWMEGLGPDAVYAVKRLVRGLASPRESSRLGFAVALTEILRAAVGVDAQSVLKLILACSDDSSVSKQELKDTLFARLFGISVMFSSGLAFRSLDIYQQCVRSILQTGNKKKWMAEAASWAVLDSFKNLSDKTWSPAALSWFVNEELAPMDWSPEKVGFVMYLQPLMQSYDWRSVMNPVMSDVNILDVSNLETIGKIMREIAVDTTSSAGTGNWRPKLHWTWTLLLDYFQLNSSAFASFWQVAVDESLFAPSASSERKMWGFLVASQALPNLSESDVAVLFTPGFVRTWINHLKSTERTLHLAARQMAEAIQLKAASDPNLGMILLSQLLGKNGSPEFDKITRTKTVANILSTLSPSGVKEYINYLKNVFATISDRRSWVLQQILALFRNASVPRHDDWISDSLEFLTDYGFAFIKRSKDSVPVEKSDQIRTKCRSTLISIFVELGKSSIINPNPKAIGSAKKLGPFESSGGMNWLQKVFMQVDSLRNRKHSEFLLEETASDLKLTNDLKRLLEAVEDQSSIPYQQSISSLCLSLWTQVIEEDKDCRQYLEDLLELSPILFSSIRHSFENPDSSAQPILKQSIESLIQIILASLNKPSALIRAASTHTFGIYSGKLSSENLDTIISQLIQPENDENDDVVKLDDHSESQNRIETADQDDTSSGSAEDSDLSDDSSDSEDEADLVMDEIDPELRKKLAVALGLELNGDADVLEDGEDLGAEEGDVSDAEDDMSNLNDAQMMALDEQLGMIFKSQRKISGKKAREAEQLAAAHTSNRVMDLVEIFVKAQPESPLMIRLLIPLLSIVASSPASESQLASRANSLLKNKISKSKVLPSAVSLQECQDILQEIHTAARQAPTSDFDTTCSLCSLQMSRLIILKDPTETQFILEVYSESLRDFVSRKGFRLQPMFFLQFIKRYPVLAWQLRSEMISAQAILPYRQAQSFNMIKEILNQNKLLVQDGLSDSIIDFMAKIRESVYSTVLGSCEKLNEENKSSRSSRLKDLIKFSIYCARLTLKLLDNNIERMDSIWDFSATEALAVTIKHHKVTKSLASLTTLVSQLEGVVLKAGKGTNAEKTDSSVSSNIKKRKAETAHVTDNRKKSKMN